MMWRSKKALDLLRDPRIVVHSVTSNKDGTDGDVKIYGRARVLEGVPTHQGMVDRRLGFSSRDGPARSA